MVVPGAKSAPRLSPPRLFNLPPGGARLPAPGLYKSEPYTCLILVPGKHPDDKALKGGLQSTNLVPAPAPMPGKVPELRFIPRNPARR